jgi:hypothetical protein
MPQKKTVQSTYDKNGDSSSIPPGARRSSRLAQQSYISSHSDRAMVSNVPGAFTQSATHEPKHHTPGHKGAKALQGEHFVGANAGSVPGGGFHRVKKPAGWG